MKTPKDVEFHDEMKDLAKQAQQREMLNAGLNPLSAKDRRKYKKLIF